MFNTLAMLASESGDLNKAIAAQQAAVDATDNERQKKRLTVMLDELKQKLENQELATQPNRDSSRFT